MTSESEASETEPKPDAKAAALERELLMSAGDIMQKAASESPFDDIIPDDEGDRLTDRPEEPEPPADNEEEQPEKERGWDSKPSVRQQATLHPETVKLVDPETKILNLGDPTQLAEYNRIQQASNDPETRTLQLLEVARQEYNGTWVALVTFARVRYLVM